jgi:hypothetical protein
MAPAIISVLLTGFLIFDALALRRRMSHFVALAPTDEPAAPGHHFLAAPGVELTAHERAAASAFARRHGLGLVDLVPGDADTLGLYNLLRGGAPDSAGRPPLCADITAAHAVLVDRTVLAAARVPGLDPATDRHWQKTVGRLRTFAHDRSALAIAPSLRASRPLPATSRVRLRAFLGLGVAPDAEAMHAGIHLALLAAIGLLAWLSPASALAVIVAYHLQLPIIFVRTAARPRDLPVSTLLRLPRAVAASLGRMSRPRPSPETQQRIAGLRVVYEHLLRNGTTPFFETQTTQCPLCSSPKLRRCLTTGDDNQAKPGTFTLDQCRDCRHIFQNPQLSRTGREFYYRGFYDGLGQLALAAVLSAQGWRVKERCEAIASEPPPRRWLDVNCVQGYFCQAARRYFPSTEFHGLGRAQAMEDAVRANRIHHAHPGTLLDMPGMFHRQFDVISMYHYLEHVGDLRAHIRAAAEMLTERGTLTIEVPDGSSRYARLLRGLWFGWTQPLTLHFVPLDAMKRLLESESLEVTLVERERAHQPIDLAVAVVLLLRRLAPSADDVPWRAAPTALDRVWKLSVWTLGLPLLVAGMGLDQLVRPVAGRLGLTNMYRITARRRATAGPAEPAG